MNAPSQGPVTIVTGACGGIGSAIVERLAAAGHRLVLNGLDPEKLDAHVRRLASLRLPALAVPGDVRDRSLPETLRAAATARFGRIDCLVSGAGTSRPVAFVDMDDEEWDRLLDINLSSVARISRAVVRAMLAQAQGGAIVHISSISHANGGANLAYGAAKGAVATLTYGMAAQLGPHGIRVNAVAPGVIDTPLVRGAFEANFNALVAGASARTPLRRIGQPQDVAEVVAFLLSDAAAFVTGALVPITGGIEFLAPISALHEGAG
ncbi:MAG: SDR family oxidoreductase [Proteobacteria bacterium]|nr:SDR family oxidoreductase [Pseudomonadota bacterium]